MRTQRPRRPLRILAALGLASLLAPAGCRREAASEKAASSVTSRAPIAKVIEAHSAELMSRRGVVGVYEGARDDGSPCIRVMLREKTPDLEKSLPRELEGWPVEIDVTGEIRPMDRK